MDNINKYYTLEDTDTHHKAIQTTLLITAIQNHNIKEAKKLLTLGADIDKPNSKGETPLLTAMRRKEFNFARYLIKKGADLKAQDIANNNTFTYAVAGQQEDIALQAIKYVNIYQWVDSSIFDGEFYLYEHYIYKNNHPDAKFANYLHLAVRYGQLKVIKYLLDRGFDIEEIVKDSTNYHFSPLEIAIIYSDVKTVKYLIDHGANPYKKYHGYFMGYRYQTLLSFTLAFGKKVKNTKAIIEYLQTLPNASWYKKNETQKFYDDIERLKRR
jgi:ankyrin repeat protein